MPLSLSQKGDLRFQSDSAPPNGRPVRPGESNLIEEFAT